MSLPAFSEVARIWAYHARSLGGGALGASSNDESAILATGGVERRRTVSSLAEPGRIEALPSEGKGHKFESCRARQ